jgi:hypothetical protein
MNLVEVWFGIIERQAIHHETLGSVKDLTTKKEFKKFLKAIDKAVPDELDVHLVWDNLATHKRRQWATGWPSTHVVGHFAPTGSSCVYQVERRFASLTDQLLHRGVHKSVAELEKNVRNWIKT